MTLTDSTRQLFHDPQTLHVDQGTLCSDMLEVLMHKNASEYRVHVGGAFKTAHVSISFGTLFDTYASNVINFS